MSEVYPRVGGGNVPGAKAAKLTTGLSPRGRGKPRFCRAVGRTRGSIPAWAGETIFSPTCAHTGEVYPRVGGGNYAIGSTARTMGGLSPRGRGKQTAPPNVRAVVRSIPAWAGETAGRYRLWRPREVYPRVGGGNRAAGSRIE